MSQAISSRRLWLAPVLVLALTLSLTLFAWHRAREAEDARELERFDDELTQVYSTMSRAASSYVNALRVVQAFVNTQPELTPEVWRKLQRGMEWQKRFPAMLEMGVAIFAPSQAGGPLGVVACESREAKSVHHTGYDFVNDEGEAKAWRAAIRGEVPMATEVKEIAQGCRGVVLFIPMWHDEMSKEARGVVFASLNPVDFYNERVEAAPKRRLTIELLALHAPNTAPLGHGNAGTFDRIVTMPGVGQGWDVRCTRGPGFANTTAHNGSWSLLGGGLLVSLLSGGLAWTQSRKQREVEARVQERTAELHHALRHEREMHAMKTHFVHLISHEFRTPLGVILTSAEMMDRYAARLPAEERDGYVRDIAAATHHMNGLIEQVLILGRSEAGYLECAAQPIDLPQHCAEWIEQTHAAHPEAAHITLDAINVAATGDVTLLRLILTNLLSNAVKYSPPDMPVSLTLKREGHDAVFFIRDHGIGIPLEYQARLFTPFHRAANVAHVPGTGLGLMIVRQCVELHHGSVELTSNPGGTVATVRLPLFTES